MLKIIGMSTGITYNDRNLRSGHERSRFGSKCRRAAEKLRVRGYVEIYPEHFVNPHVLRR